MITIVFPEDSVNNYIALEVESPSNRAQVFENLRKVFFESLLVPINETGGTFEDVANYMDIREVVKSALKSGSNQVSFSQAQYDQLYTAANSYRNWSKAMPELVLWLRDALAHPEKDY